MHPDIRPDEFTPGQTIYVFEQGEGTYRSSRLSETGTLLHEVDFDGEIVTESAHNCFNDERSRVWRMHAAAVEVSYLPEGVRIINKGAPTTVWYHEKWSEKFETGEELHKDWRGLGIEFDYLIDAWLRRLNGEHLPLWAGELDPKYAYLSANEE